LCLHGKNLWCRMYTSLLEDEGKLISSDPHK
jgi:hypothetical protein